MEDSIRFDFNKIFIAGHNLNLPAVQNQISPIILTFGANDPIGASGITADLATFSAMGCYGLSVITSILVADTSSYEDIHALEAELVEDQARTVLEDIQVIAFKVGQVGSLEIATAIAEITSDYPEQALVLDPFSEFVNWDHEDSEDILLAIRELLIPQATVVCLTKQDLSRISESWLGEEVEQLDDAPPRPSLDVQDDNMEGVIKKLLEYGCEYVLIRDQLSHGQLEMQLHHEEGLIVREIWDKIPSNQLGMASTISAALTALLANGLDILQALNEAQEFTRASMQKSMRVGMGKVLPDRFFWATPVEESNLEDALPTESDILIPPHSDTLN